MFIAIRERLERGREEGGFTLIELMVVVLIIAILIAIAIPTFLGARKRAQDKQAQSNLRNALTAEKTYYVDNQVYTDDATALGDIESALNFASQDASARGVTPFVGADDQVVILVSDSKSGTTFCLADIAGLADAGTYYSTGCTGAEVRATVAGWDKTPTGWS